MFTYFLYPVLMHILPCDTTAELMQEMQDEMETGEESARAADLNVRIQAGIDNYMKWSYIARAFQDLLVAVRSVSGFRPGDAPDLKVS